MGDWYEARANGNANDFNTWKRNGVNATSGQIPATGTTVRVNDFAVNFSADQTIGLNSGLTAPQASADLPSLSQSAGGGALAQGTYHALYTNVDGSGNESGPSGEASLFLNNNNDTLIVTLPALPGGISSRNIYLSSAYTGSYNGRLYKTGVTGTTVNCTSGSWTDGTTTWAGARPIPCALLIAGSGTVTIPTGVTVTAQGDIADTGAGLTLTGAAGIEFDVPSGKVYGWLVGTTSNNTAKITASGSGWFIRAKSGAGKAWIGAGNTSSGGRASSPNGLDLTGTGTLTRLDDGAAGIDIALFGGSGKKVKFHGVTFDACNRIKSGAGTDVDSQLEWVDCKFINSVGTYNLDYVTTGITPTGTGTRLLDNCSFDKIVRLDMDGFTVQNNCRFNGGTEFQGTEVALFDGNFVRFLVALGEMQIPTKLTNCWLLSMNATATDLSNQHWLVNTLLTGKTFDLTDNACEGWAIDDGGDFLIAGGDGNVYNFERNIGIRSAVVNTVSGYRGGPGTIPTSIATPTDTGLRYNVNHNTWFLGGQAALAMGELGSGSPPYFVGMIGSYKSNYVWSDGQFDGIPSGTATAYHINKHPAAAPLDDVLPAANATNNMRYLLGVGSAGKGYNFTFSSGSPGANDVLGDIGFVEERNLLTFANSLGKTGTDNAKALAVIDDLMAGTVTVADYLTHIRAGYAPTNVAAHNAAHDGTDIGAVQGVWGGQSPYFGDNAMTGGFAHSEMGF